MIYKGLSYLEVLLVIALIAVLVGATVPFISQYNSNINVITMEQTVKNALREAQYYSMIRKDDEEWGVCIENNKIIVYAGDCINPVKSLNYTILSNITISGLTDVSFSNIRGEPNLPITVTIQSRSTAKSISMNSVGGITITKQ